MKFQKFPIFLLAGAALLLASCDDKTAEQPKAAISVDKYKYEVNESMTLHFIGNADNVVVYPGDNGHDYELRDQSNSGLVVNKGIFSYSYRKTGVFKVVCVATNHEDVGNSIKTDTTSVWVTVIDDNNTLSGVSVNLLNRNELSAEALNDTDWLLAIPRKARFNGKDVTVPTRNQQIYFDTESTTATVSFKEEGADESTFKVSGSNNRLDLAKVYDIRCASGSGDSRDYKLYGLYIGEFKTFKVGGVTAILTRSEYDYYENTIDVKVPAGTDLTALTQEFTLNSPATEKVYIGDVEQTSGSVADFSSPVTYRFVVSHPDKPSISVVSTCVVTVTAE